MPDEKMTPMRAWGIISANLMHLYKIRKAEHPNVKPYTDAEISAEVICYEALRRMQKEEGVGNG